MIDDKHEIKVGISSCLLGNEVRYDGGHKSNDYIRQTLSQYFEFKPFCPELESGMSVPRPPIQLRHTEQGIRCVVVKDHERDVTEQLQSCNQKQDHWLGDLCGYILKNGSPSCGMERVKVYRNEHPDRSGTGIFAQYLKDHYPLLPIEEEGRLGDAKLRENFIQRVYVYHRWKQFSQEIITPSRLQTFHSQHKLIAMSHEQNMARSLSQQVANATKKISRK
ncbi:MAG: DUF523 and DUF1722 domain-containing protein [Methyloprofundus sp.]|uniref:DUF523 domain-containing protein n=1 Tax=Methyloprofundus sp. TaxID=2020875 RepID=UPI003258D21C